MLGFAARLFLPLIAVLTLLGFWLLSEAERNTTYSLAPPAPAPELPANTVADLGPASGPQPAKPDARPPREQFARPFDLADRRPRMAVIVTGLGLKRDVTLKAIDEAPPEATLAFSPYADGLGDYIARARERGHEVLLAVPMEPGDPKTRDAGPAALTVAAPEAATRRRFDWMASRATGFVGVIGDLGDRFGRDPVAMKPVLDEIAKRGLLYIDNRVEAGAPATGPAGVHAAAVSVWLDRELAADAIDRQIAAAEAVARRGGSVVALAGPYPVTLARLSAWYRALDRRSLAPAPVSAVVRGDS